MSSNPPAAVPATPVPAAGSAGGAVGGGAAGAAGGAAVGGGSAGGGTAVAARGTAEGSGPAAARERPPLRRPRDCVVSGVSAGLSLHLGWPVWVVRTSFVALTLVSGAGVLLYAWLWLFMPWDDVEPGTGPDARPAGGAAASGRADDPALDPRA